MSMTPAEIASSAAGVSRPQALGSELDRMRLAASEQARLQRARQQAEQAAGVGRTPDNPQVSDRDADGRLGWLRPEPRSKDELARQDAQADDAPTGPDKPGPDKPGPDKPGPDKPGPDKPGPATSDVDELPGTWLDISG